MAKRGRPPGSKNDGWRAAIAAKYPGWHPVQQLADVANDIEAEPARRDAAATTCARYYAPQLKAIDHTGKVDANVGLKLSGDQLRAMAAFVHAKNGD